MEISVQTLCSYQLWARPPEEGFDHLLKGHLQRVSNGTSSIIKDLFKNSMDPLEFGFQLDELIKLSKIVGGSHDIAKGTPYFQTYVKSFSDISQKKVNLELRTHSPLSALYSSYASNRIFDSSDGNRDFLLLEYFGALSVLGHHSRLSSPLRAASKLLSWQSNLQEQVGSIHGSKHEELEKILSELSLPRLEDFESAWKTCLKRFHTNAQTVVRKIDREGQLSSYYLVNILFSSLLDADRLDAAGLTSPPLTNMVNAEMVSRHVENLANMSKSEHRAAPEILSIRKRLFEILAQKAQVTDLQRRICSLSAPTGSGKTLSSIYFALILRERLIRSGKPNPRIIYVAPFLSILDQNFKVLQQTFGFEGQSEILLQHHHLCELSFRVINESSTEEYSTLGSELMIEGWNAEIIVTTFIQFLYTILGSRPSQLRKFHNLVGSIVILDEVQSIPYQWWHLIRETLKFLSDKLKMFFILMTATQPLIFDKGEIEELVENTEKLFAFRNCRIEADFSRQFTLDEFSRNLLDIVQRHPNESIMILMNTIGSATKVFEVLKSNERRKLEYLSAELVPYDRSRRLESIFECLRAKEPLVLVTTQVVEAGVDVDFNYVIRDLGPVDSIVQASGRCNRNGLRPLEISTTSVFEVSDEKGSLAKRIYGSFAIDKTKDSFTGWSSEGDVRALVHAYYKKTREGMSHEASEKILSGLSRRLKYEELDNFVIIEEQPSASVFIEFNQDAAQIWKEYEKIRESNESGLQKKVRFLKMRDRFYSFVINISQKYASGIPEENGFLHVDKSELIIYYDPNTGFIRDQSGIIG